MISSHRSKTQFAKADSRRPRLKLILLLCLLHAVALLAVFLAARAVYGQSSAIEDATQGKANSVTIAPEMLSSESTQPMRGFALTRRPTLSAAL
jgi:VIT1/CCC1 family predicted Fe2+/Mn2+ transporter